MILGSEACKYTETLVVQLVSCFYDKLQEQIRRWGRKNLQTRNRYVQIYFLDNSFLCLTEVSEKEGFKTRALRREVCSATTFVLNRKRAAVTGSYTSLLYFPAQGCLVGTVGGKNASNCQKESV